MLDKVTITVPNTAVTNAEVSNAGKKIIFKNCPPFADWISETNNTRLDNAKDNDVVLLIYNLIEYSSNYSKTSESLWQIL